ncbi:toxin VasX [Aeromonas rivuli]|uniref:toxin VasX n=1 Tax=Aeromonas rivuli TaxID=648794 RepID=UPI001CCBA270|nr:toxin VasX [Aeromonas rivuli]UBO72468.1 hypothetical protein KYK33_11240 [Aeromonas rivuli]
MSTPNQAAQCASPSDGKNPNGACPFKNKEIAIVPVRYALDEVFETGAKQPHPLPAKEFKGPLTLKGSAYTLRQLRDGWLYVYDETAKVLDEYEIKGAQFISASKGSKGHLLYPATHKLSMMFAHQPWTDRLKVAYGEQRSLRSKGMRSFSLLPLASKLGGMHAGLLSLLESHVADMAQANQGFPLSCAPLNAPAEAKPGLLWCDKAAQAASAYQAGIPDPQSALMVALDDPISDMHDLTLRLSDTWARQEAPFKTDSDRHRWSMAGITEMLALPPLSEAELPAAARGNRLASFRFKRKVQGYLAARHAFNEKVMNGSGNNYSLAEEQRLQAMGDELEQAGYTPSRALAQWSGARLTDEVNWTGLEALIAAQQPLLDELREQWQLSFADALLGLDAVGKEPLPLGIDPESPEGQHFLLSANGEWLNILAMTAPGEKQAAELHKQLGKGALPALVYYGFSAQTKEELIKDTPWLNIGNGTALANASAGWSALAADGRLLDSALFAGLGKSAQATMTALNKAVTGPGMQAWERLTMALHPALLKGQQGSAWVAAAALEAVHTGQSARFNPNFASELQLWALKVGDAAGSQSRLLGNTGQAVTPLQVQRLQEMSEQIKAARTPRILLLGGGNQEAFEARVARYQGALAKGGAQGARAASQVWGDWGNFGGVAALVNMANLACALNGFEENQRKARGDAKAQSDQARALAYTAAWTGSAIAGVYQGKAYGQLTEDLLKLSIKNVTGDSLILASRFALSMGAMAGLGLVAATLEGLETLEKMKDGTNSEIEQFAYGLKALGLAGQWAAAFGSGVGLLTGASITAIFAPWMVVALAIGGIAYLLATLLLGRYGRIPLERWLLQSTWGSEPNLTWTPAIELQEYERLTAAPQIEMTNTELVIRLPNHIDKISLKLGARRMVKMSYPDGSPRLMPRGDKPEAIALASSNGQGGEYRVPHTLNPHDQLIALITYPADESLSGTAQRFVVRGDLRAGVVLTAERDASLPIEGIMIGIAP